MPQTGWETLFLQTEFFCLLFNFGKGLYSCTVSQLNLNAQCENGLVSKKCIKSHCTRAQCMKPSCDLQALRRLNEKQLFLLGNVNVLAIVPTRGQSTDELQTDGRPWWCSLTQSISQPVFAFYVLFSQSGCWRKEENCAFRGSKPQQIYLLSW